MQQAIFVGWQEGYGDIKPFPLFNILGGIFEGSTVAKETLQEKGVSVPKYPTYSHWKKYLDQYNKLIKETNL